jgi:hypothetical protein
MLRRFLLLCAVGSMLLPLKARSAAECRDDLNEADGYTIRSVKVEGRWVPPIALPIKPGDRFSNAKVQEAMRAVQRALADETRDNFELQNMGAAGVTHITRCLRVEGREVDVIIQPRSLRVDLYQVGQNVLPIPRAPFATFYNAVPTPLLAFNPVIGAYQDKHYGFAPTFGIASDLLALRQTLRGQPATEQNAQLDLMATGRKSVEHSFYDANVHLALTSLRPGEFLEQAALELGYDGTEQPRGDDTFGRQAGEIGGAIRLKARSSALFQTVNVGAKYRWSHNDFAPNGNSADADENAGELRLLAEGRTGGGFLRAALWVDGAAPNHGSDYGRIAGLVGYAKEFLVATNQTIGVEAIVGAGKAWSAPAYAQFYGGNTDRDFLYDGLQSPGLAAFPKGPVIRSFGEGDSRRDGRGADDYWHINLNVSFPIPSLSAPLIPNEEVAPGVTLKRLLKNKAGDSVSHLAVQFESEGMSPEAALAKAKAIYGEVQPAVEFVADRANVYALKPLLLCDVAGESADGTHRVHAALGAGLQLTIVTARMEIGYMHTVAGQDDGSGNFFGRIVFENIF